ncbi:hypothetical protein NADFUDRAFT_52249 [Nadsonia fulvescens var. elongata DSM 6958]|uniref:DUF3955 domain-containing protein n=1 Tax=Nadsonia fulvescens var. elongata DSM 6958 TaxID=857566 RepID=A0A1E3PIC5_9ASCO|nr:hypothetical protein NADFUDRAFT_52249 [Nadsonia fulvescens var. elongata DSM 6958]
MSKDIALSQSRHRCSAVEQDLLTESYLKSGSSSDFRASSTASPSPLHHGSIDIEEEEYESSLHEKQRRKKRWKLGLILLFFVVMLWTISGFLVNLLFQSGEYEKPYFVTYINTGTFSVYLIPTLYRYITKRYFTISSPHCVGNESRPLNEHSQMLSSVSLPELDHITHTRTNEPHSSQSSSQFTVKETAILSSQFCILWFISNLLNNASLAYTSVSSATILSCTSSFFTLIVGAIFKVETFTMTKFGALCLSLVGIILITEADNSTRMNENPDLQADANWIILGNLMALGGALLYGVYTTLLKLKIGDESRINTKLFFGFVGMFNIILLGPIIILFNYFNIENFELPPTQRVLFIVLGNALSTLISDFFWVLAMLMTSPLVVTVGLGATIPLAMAGDMIFKHRYVNIFYYFGALLVCISFVIINRYDEPENNKSSEYPLIEEDEPI